MALIFCHEGDVCADRRIDSLQALISGNHDSVKARMYNQIAELYFGKSPDSLQLYASHALRLARKSKVILQEAKALRNMGEVYNEKGLYDESLKYFFQALQVYSNAKNPLASGHVLNSIGNAYTGLGNHRKAKEYYELCLKESENIPNPQRLQAIAAIGLGNAAQNLGDFKTAEKWFLKASGLMHVIGNKWGEAVTLANLGSLYLSMREYDKSFAMLSKAEEISNELDLDYGRARIAVYLADYYQKVRKYDYAIAKLAFAYRLDLSRNAWDNCYSTTLSIADLYREVNRFDSAYSYLKLAMIYRDSTANLERLSSVAKAESKFEIEKRDIEIKTKELQLKAEMALNETRSRQVITLTIGGLLVTGLGLVAYRNYKKSNEARKLILQQKILIEDKQRLIIDSINFASRVQETILKTSDLNRVFPKHFLFFQPKDIVSGDFFWLFEHGRHIYLGVFDCTGHGVPGAMMSMTINSMLNELAQDPQIQSPAQILSQLHGRLFMNFRSNYKDDSSRPGCDAGLVLINPQEKWYMFSGARCPLLIKRGEAFEWLKANPFSVGELSPEGSPVYNLEFNETKMTFEEDDLLVFSSDGFIEQLSESNTPFGRKRFLMLMEEVIRRKDMDAQQRIRKAFDEWKGARPQFDDVIVMGIQLNISLS